eukprot:4617437-Prymnesium_polylepis.1
MRPQTCNTDTYSVPGPKEATLSLGSVRQNSRAHFAFWVQQPTMWLSICLLPGQRWTDIRHRSHDSREMLVRDGCAVNNYSYGLYLLSVSLDKAVELRGYSKNKIT